MEDNELLFDTPSQEQRILPDTGTLTPVANSFNSYNPNSGASYADKALRGLEAQLGSRTMDDMLQPIGYDPIASSRDRYVQSDYFAELGFDPFRDNESLYGQRQTRMNKLSNAFAGMGALAYDQFFEQATSWSDTFNVMGDMATGDFSLRDAFQQAEMEEINKRQTELFNANPIFETQADREGIFNFNTIANTIQQSGYAVGAIAEIAAEEAALSALTAVTFGAASEIQAARTAKLAMNIGKIARRTEELVDATQKASTLRKIWSGMARAGEFVGKNVLPLGNTIDFAQDLNRLRRVDDIAMGGAKALARTTARGFGSFYRDVRELNLAISEAKAEAAGTFSELQTKMEDRFRNDNGREPDEMEKASIKDEALRAAQTNGALNSYLILVSNKIAFGSMLKGFGPLRTLLDDDIAKGLIMLGEKDAAKVGKKFIEAADNRWLAFKHTMLKNPVKYAEANFAEALQENAQDLSNQAVQDWYMNKEKGHELESAFNSFQKAAADQFSVQGAKTFISGFLTGSILGAGSKIFESAGKIGQFVSDREGYTQRATEEKSRTTAIKDTLNNIYENPLSYSFNPKEGVVMQANFASLMKQAAADKDKKFFHDIQDDAMRHFIMTGINTGTLDVLTGRIRDYVKNLSPEEFTQAFGVEYSKENHASMMEQVSRFEAKAEQVSKTMAKLQRDFVNPFNPAQFKQGSPEFMDEAMNYMAYREALNQMAFMQDTYQSTIVRQQQVLDGIKTKPGFENLPFTSLFTLTSYTELGKELAILATEAEATTDPTLKAEKTKKIKQLTRYQKALDKYLTKMDAINASQSSPQEQEKAKADALAQFKKQGGAFFNEYVNSELEKAGQRPVQKATAMEAFDNLTDYFQLQADQDAVLEHINLLADPDAFGEFLNRHYKSYRAFVAKRKAEQATATEEETEAPDPAQPDTLGDDQKGNTPNPAGTEQTNPTDEEQLDDPTTSKPVFGMTFFFKTIGVHFDRNGNVNKENGANRFFRFTERMMFEPDTYFLVPVTKDNDDFGIRREDMFADDIKLILVKKVGDVYEYIDQAGNVIETPTKDNIVYISMPGNATLFGADPAAAIESVKKQFATKDMTDEQIQGAIENYKKEREALKAAIAKGDTIVLPVTGRSKGTPVLAPKDIDTGMPQEIPLQGSIIKTDTDDFLNLEHPNGEEIELVVATVDNAINMGNVDLGRMVARGKKTGNVFYIKNRKATADEVANIKEALKALTKLMGKKGLSAEQNQQKKDILSFLGGAIFWASPQKGKDISKNQFYVSKGKLFRGEQSWKFDAASIEAAAGEILKDLYFSVNNNLLNKKGQFISVKMNNGIAERERFASYNAFLMSNEGGRTPLLYTNTKPFNSDVNSDDFQIEGRYLLFNTSDEPVSSKIPAAGQKDTKDTTPEPSTGGLKWNKGKKTTTEVKPTTNTANPAPTNTQKGFARKFGQATETKATEPTVTPAEEVTNATSAATSTPPAPASTGPVPAGLNADAMAALMKNDVANSEDGTVPFQEQFYRLAGNNPNVKPEDLAQVRAFMSRVLPQIPLHVTGNLIHNKAYGAFMRGAIYLYENAEEGTGFHEAFEAVWNSYLTTQEQAMLAKEFSSRKGTFTNPFTGETKEYKDANMYDVREMLAEEFRTYIMTGALPAASPKVKSFFTKLLDFIKKILGMSTEDRAEMDSLVNNLFTKINSGGFVNAVPVRDLENLQAVYRAIPGTTQEVTSYAVEGVTAYFFMNLYKDGKNTDALIKADAENNRELVRLFNMALEDMKVAIDAHFESAFQAVVKDYEKRIKRAATEQEITLLKNDYFIPNNRLYSQLESVRQQPMELYQLFKNNMARFGISFSDISESMEVVPDETEADGLGITDAIKIDPRKFGATNFKLLLGSLTEDMWNDKTKSYQFKKNLLGLPKLAAFDRTYAILLNELNGSMSRVEGGQFIPGIDAMFERLDKRFAKKNGVYKEGFEWIFRMKVRLKYINPRTGEKIPVDQLSPDDIRLRVAFEQSLTNMQNDPVKMVFGGEGVIYNDASLTTASQNNIRAEWSNAIKDTAKPFNQKDGDSLLGINDNGNFAFDKNSTEYQYIMAANTYDDVLEALAIMGINFTATNKALMPFESEITDAFSAIRSKMADGSINTLEQLFGKTIVNGPIQTLLTIEVATTPEENVLVHKNAEGENQYTITQPSTISYLINSFKQAKTLADFVSSNPQFGTVDKNGVVTLHAYQTNSMLLRPGGMLFDKNGKKRKGADITYHLVSGVTEASGNGKNTDVLTYPDRVMQEINHLLNNIHYTIINSDKSTEWGLGLDDPFISFEDTNISVDSKAVLKVYLEQLSDEIDAAIEEHKNPSRIQYYSKEVKKLAHFRDILGSEFAGQIKNVVEGKASKSSLISSPEVAARIMEYLEGEIERTKQALLDMDMFYDVDDTEDGGFLYATEAVNADLLRAYGIENSQAITEAELNALISYLVINKEVAVTEQHKFIYGHPALFKDLAKRSNGANSTKAAFIDNMDIRQWMDVNMSRMDGKKRSEELHSTFNTISFKDNTVAAAMMVEYVETMYKSMMELQKDKEAVQERIGADFTEDGKFVKLRTDKDGKNYGDAAKYLDINEADAQAWIMPDMYRDLLYMSSRMTHDQEAQWEYEKAYEIIARSQKPMDHVAYRSYSPSVIEAARKVMAKGNPGHILQVLKPQYFGYNAESPIMHTVFLKNSTQPKFYRHIENTAFENLYVAAQDQQIDIIGFESGEKVGNILNSEGGFTPIYNADNQVNIPQNEQGITGLPDIPVQKLFSRYLGIQQETPNVFKNAVVRGSQVTKLIMSNFKYRGKYTSKEAENLLTEYNDILTQMISLGKTKLLKELGVTQDAAGNYKVKDVSKMVDLLKREAISRELPDNIVDAIDTIEDDFGNVDLRYPLDALPNRDKIDNILNSIVDSRVVSEKMNGKPAVQVASTLFESKKRDMVYLKDGVWTSAAGVNMEDLSDAERASLRMTSNDLKFYRMENGKIANMEVYLPNFLEGVSMPGLKNGVISVKDIDPRILQALGFRIPTQGMNSIESITIKGFLPREMGDMVVVPSEITGKAGSDFDIDKLQMYLANFYVARNGKATYIEWKGTQQATREFYAKEFDKGEFISEDEQAQLDEFLPIALAMNAREVVSIPDGVNQMRNVLTKYFDVDTLSKEFLEELKDRKARKNAVLNAVVKKAMQNRYREIMQGLVTLPENMRQLITPNSVDTLKDMAAKINELKGVEDITATAKYAIYRSLIDSSDIRHRFLSGKKLVGIAALQITSQVMAQLGETKLSGKFDHSKLYYIVLNEIDGKLSSDKKETSINLKHNYAESEGFEQLYLDGLTTQDGMLISDLINEALSGFVDAAKDPFVFSLNITLDTASTWFYLQKLGVPIEDLAYFFNQPVLDRLFKERAKNRSIFKRVADNKLTDFMVALKVAGPYIKAIYPEMPSLYNTYVEAKLTDNFKVIKKVREQFIAIVKQSRQDLGKVTNGKVKTGKALFTTEELRDAVRNMNTEGYEMTVEDGKRQLALLADYLEYSAQGSQMTDFIGGIGYDNTKTKSITENVMQIGRWNKVKSAGFIANPEGIMQNTFMGKLQKEKADIFELFTPFFMSLDYRARAAFEPVLELVDSGAFLTRDSQNELIMSYHNFIINYIMQTTPITKGEGATTTVAAQADRLLFGENSMAKRLKKFKDSTDKNIQNNIFLKELLAVLSNEEGVPDTVKLLKRATDSYRANMVIESAKDLHQYAMNSGNTELVEFMEDLAYLAIIQGGGNMSAFNFTRTLPVEIFSRTAKLVVDAFKNNKQLELDVASIWKQFHQNNYRNDVIVPNAKFYKKEGNFIKVSSDMDTAKRPYVKIVSLNKAYSKEQQEELRRNRQYDKLYTTTIYERYETRGGNTYFRPINKKGIGNMFTEVGNATGFGSLVGANNTAREELYPSNRQPIAKPEVVVTPSPVAEPLQEKGAIKMQADNIAKIKAGTKTITNRTEKEKLEDGIYTMPDGTKVEVRLLAEVMAGGTAVDAVDFSNWTMGLDEYAQAEGFKDWADFDANNKFSAKFVSGKESRFAYSLKVIEPVSTDTDTSGEQPSALESETIGGTTIMKMRDGLYDILDDEYGVIAEYVETIEEARRLAKANEAAKTATGGVDFKTLKVGDKLNVMSLEDSSVVGTVEVVSLESPDFIRFDMDFGDYFKDKGIGYSQDEFNSLFALQGDGSNVLTPEQEGVDPFSDTLSVETSTEEPVEDGVIKDKKYELFPGVYANAGQRAAIDKIRAFLKGEGEGNLFLLKGRGGTGKTTIIQKAIAEANIPRNAIIGATVSYEAKNVLQEAMKGYNTTTIAGLLGLRMDFDDNGAMFFRERTADEERDFRAQGKADRIESAKLIIVDEASMIGDFIYDKLLEKMRGDAKIIFMGDNAQIPPIDVENGSDSPVWSLMAPIIAGNVRKERYAELTERMRQKAESPILPVTDVFARNIELIQNNQPGWVKNPLEDRTTKMENGEGVMFTDSADVVLEEYMKDFQNPALTKGTVIVGARNATVDNFNMRIREQLFPDSVGTPYEVGEFIRVNSPHYARTGELMYENGLKGYVRAVREKPVEGSDFTIYEIQIETTFTDMEGKEQKRMVRMDTINPAEKNKLKTVLAGMAAKAKRLTKGTQEYKKAWAEFYTFKESIVDVGYGYAITSHKVQGSTYDSTYVLENDIMTFPGGVEQQNRMMYTAVSRPRKKLVVFSSTAVTGTNTGAGIKFARKFPIAQVKEDKDKGC